MNRKILYYIVFVVFAQNLFTSCNFCNREDFDLSGVKSAERTHQVIEDMIDNISSPIEMASLMRTLNVPFSQKFLASTKNISSYNTNYDKAFNLGVFGCDLGYLNMYGMTSMVLDYIATMKRLADDLHIGQFFDFTTMRRIATNNQNVDSLVSISQQSFNKMDKHLQANNRGNLSVLMITGVWIEGLYLTAQFYKERPNEKRLAESIGEQKIILEKLLELLRNFNQERYIIALTDELTALNKLYDEISIEVVIEEPEAVERDGVLTIIQNETSVVVYTDAQMKAIIEKAEEIRNKQIKAN